MPAAGALNPHATPHDLLPCVLLQGDINHWVAVLDHFDSFFEQRVSQRSDVQMQGEAAAEDPPFPTEACLAVLTATCVLLENCSNKAAYNSSEVRTHTHLPGFGGVGRHQPGRALC